MPSTIRRGTPVSARVANRCDSADTTPSQAGWSGGRSSPLTPVRAAIAGETDKMVTLLRGDTDQYTCETGLAPLSDIANGVKKLPREWINEDGVSMNFQFLRYAQPLIQGEVHVPFDNGLPVFAQLSKSTVDKVLPGYET